MKYPSRSTKHHPPYRRTRQTAHTCRDETSGPRQRRVVRRPVAVRTEQRDSELDVLRSTHHPGASHGASLARTHRRAWDSVQYVRTLCSNMTPQYRLSSLCLMKVNTVVMTYMSISTARERGALSYEHENSQRSKQSSARGRPRRRALRRPPMARSLRRLGSDELRRPRLTDDCRDMPTQ